MPKTARFGKLHSIGEDGMHEVDKMLLAGSPAREVASFIHDGLKKLADIKPDSLKKTLERYRGTDLREKAVATVAGATKGMTIQTLAKKLNAMEEIEKLVLVQKVRFEKILLTEQKNDSFVLKAASDEGRLLKEMLVELGKLQLETGVLQRAPKKLTGVMKNGDGEITSFEWTQEQEELMREIENVEYAVR